MAQEFESSERAPRTDRIQLLSFSIWIGLMVYLSLKALMLCQTELPSFDGAYNLQIPITLSKTGKYATSYHETSIFNHYATHTGPTVLLPTAAVFALFGVSPFTGQLISAIYLILFLAIISLYIRSLTHSWAIASCGILLVCATPYFFEYAHQVYGEIPALFFLLAGVLILDREGGNRRLLRAGCVGTCFGLAYITKTVMLIAAPAVAAALAYGLLIRKSLSYREIGILLGAFVSVIGLFECFRAVQLGSDYFGWWRFELMSMLRESGAVTGLPDSQQDLVGKVTIHLESLRSALGVGSTLSLVYIASLIATITAAGIVAGRNSKDIRLSHIVIVGTIVLYFVWWLGITPTSRAWYRRILQGLILCHLALVCGLYLLPRRLFPHQKVPQIASCVWIAVLIGCMAWTSRGSLMIRASRSADYQHVASLVSDMQALPGEPVFYGFGWWQAPQVSFLLGRDFRDLKRSDLAEFPEEEANAYLVVDALSSWLGSEEVNRALSEYNVKLLKRHGFYSLYRIRSRRSPAQLPESEVRSYVDFSNGDYERTTGLFSREGADFRWSKVTSSIHLRRSDETHLELKGVLPAHRYDGDVHFSVHVGGRVLARWQETPNGAFSKVMPLPGFLPKHTDLVVRIHCSSLMRRTKFESRALSFALRAVGFIEQEGEISP